VVRENNPEPGEGEQTWPTDQELMDAEVFAKQQQRKRVPKGTSAYQAAWIPDDEGGSEGSEEWEDAPEAEGEGEGAAGGPGEGESSSWLVWGWGGSWLSVQLDRAPIWRGLPAAR
jgi:pre-rRNA-processing protein TSR1